MSKRLRQETSISAQDYRGNVSEALARIRKSCARVGLIARGVAVVAVLFAFVSVLVAVHLTSRALDAGAPNVWTALYTGVEDGAATGGGDVFTVSRHGSYVDAQGQLVDVPVRPVAMQSVAVGIPESLFMLATALYAARLFEWVAESGRPFSDRVVHDVRMLGRLLLAWALVPALTCKIADMLHPADPVSYAMSGGSGSLVIAALVVFALCRIFSYGCILQTQDDETL